jgi:hypothetical protein
MRVPGDVAEWLGSGLQSRGRRFDSARRLGIRVERSPGGSRVTPRRPAPRGREPCARRRGRGAARCRTSRPFPGIRISARRSRRRSTSIASTRQASTGSPTRRLMGSRRPLRSPGPPSSTSTAPRRRQTRSPAYQPVSPPIARMVRKALVGDPFAVTERASMRREPSRVPPKGRRGVKWRKVRRTRAAYREGGGSSRCRPTATTWRAGGP